MPMLINVYVYVNFCEALLRLASQGVHSREAMNLLWTFTLMG